VRQSGTNPFAAIAAGVACLWGPAHGGANEAALNMLEDIQRNGGVEKIGEFIKQVKDKNSNVKLMGFGHRVYKNYDPRAKLMRETCHEVLAALGLHDDPLFKLAMALEKIALEDDYFVSRKLYPNVDFYSGIVQRAIGIPVSLFTAIFALARTVGWIAQLNEMIGDPEYKIGRPRQLFVGKRVALAHLFFKPIVQRRQCGALCIGGLCGHVAGSVTFQQRQQMVDLRHVFAGDLGDVCATAWLHGHQTFGRQHLERLAQRRAADAVFDAEFHLVDPASRLQRARKDLLPQAFCHVLIQRTTRQRGCRRRGHQRRGGSGCGQGGERRLDAGFEFIIMHNAMAAARAGNGFAWTHSGATVKGSCTGA
jgi:hypothetical protein